MQYERREPTAAVVLEAFDMEVQLLDLLSKVKSIQISQTGQDWLFSRCIIVGSLDVGKWRTIQVCQSKDGARKEWAIS